MLVHRFLVGLLFLCGTTLAHAQAGEDALRRELAVIREGAFIMPGESLRQLDGMKAGRSGVELGLVLVETSRAYYWLGDRRHAVEAALQAEQLGRDLHDDALLAKAMLGHGRAASRLMHDQDTARRLYQQADALAARTDDAHLKTATLVYQGLLAEEDGRIDDAMDFMRRAVDQARLGPDPDALSLALRERARLLADGGSHREALALTDELLAIAKQRGIPALLAHARLAEYATAARAGQPRRAEAALQAAIDQLEALDARERLAAPLANLAELYIQGRRFGEAYRASSAALRIARERGDENGHRLAAYQLGMTTLYLRRIAEGRAQVERALESLKGDERYLRMLLDYAHALNQVGERDVAMTVYEKAGAVSLAAWRKERQLSYEALQRAYAYQKKQSELAEVRHETVLKAADLKNTRRQRSLWVLLTVTAVVAGLLIAFLYRRVRKTNKLLHVKNEQLFLQSTRDSLTGLFNRHYFYSEVVPCYHAGTTMGDAASAGTERRARGEAKPGGVFLLMDIDHFKSINDRFGHGAGDTVLKNVAARLKSVLREDDFLIRWGGEEFLAWLPGVATFEARQVCERLLLAVSSTPIEADGQSLTVTTSIGFCPKPAEGTRDGVNEAPGWESLVHLADLCLYLAKTAGRNQAFGVSDATLLTPEALAQADADLKQASLDGVVELVNVKSG